MLKTLKTKTPKFIYVGIREKNAKRWIHKP